MAKHLTLDEMLESLTLSDHSAAFGFKLALQSIGSAMAKELAEHCGVDFRPARDGIGGIMADFAPLYSDEPDPVPVELELYDDDADWEPFAQS